MKPEIHLKESMKKLSAYKKTILILVAASLVLNLLGFSGAFCDAYTDTVYGLISDIGGRITDLFPFILGELILYLSALAILAGLILAVLMIPLRKKEVFTRFSVRFFKGFLLYVVIMLFIYTVNWVVPYRGKLLGGKYEATVSCDEPHLLILREYLVEKLDEEAALVPRDASGTVIWPDDETVREEIATSMRALSDRYPRLSGYYPKLKNAMCSEILNYMSIGGYTYPYTMELTGNRFLDRFYYPSLCAHEAAHHQGYYKENEANYLSFLACITSDDPTLRYSGYLRAYHYVDKAYRCFYNDLTDEQKERYKSTAPSKQVNIDRSQSLALADAEFEASKRWFRAFQKTAEQTAKVGWKTQEQVIAENGYDAVVPLILEYYKGILY